MLEKSPDPKRLSELGLFVSDGILSDPIINNICVDSRKLKAGNLFAAMPGALQHGCNFIESAIMMNAAAILTDLEGLKIARQKLFNLNIPIVVSKDPRLSLSKATARFYSGQPATMVAITGTNGKTSVANFTRQIWENLGKKAVNIGTSGVEGAYSSSLSHTTPEPIILHKLSDCSI